MEQIIVLHPDGTSFPLIKRGKTCAVTKAEQRCALLGEDTVTLTVVTTERLNFYIGDRIEVFGKSYTMNQPAVLKKTGTRKLEYSLTFEGVQYELIDAQWLLPDETVLDTFTGNLEDFLTMLVNNANRVFPGRWEKGIFPDDTEYKTLSYSGRNCLEVLQALCKEYSTEFEITQANGIRTINIKTTGVNFPYTFRFGRTGGLYELSRQNINSKNVITRLYVYGGSSNLGNEYRYNRLCLPGKEKNDSYIENEAAVAAFGLKENIKNFEKTFPNRYGSVTAAGSKYYSFIDGTMNFDLNEKDESGATKYLIPGVTAKIKMTEGNLAGYEFDLHKYDPATKEIQVVPFTDENGMEFPSPTSAAFQFDTTGKYIFTDINLPESYKTDAEAQLLEEGTEYYNQYCQPQVQYALSIAENFISQFSGQITVANLFAVGDYIPVEDEDIGVNKAIRITAFTRDLLQPYKYSITLGDSVQMTTITRIISDLQEIDRIIEINNLADPAKARRNWRAAQEVLANVFDPDGHYYSEKIKPLSIETGMLAVGSRSQQFVLQNCRFEPNYEGNANVVRFIGGSLVHYTIQENGIKSWTLASTTISGLASATSYYIYARCQKAGTAGSIMIDTTQRTVDSDATYYYFLIGSLSSVITDTDGTNPARLISLTYGSTTINGRFINTGRIQSSGGGVTYFDLDNGEIGGNIKFISSDGTTKNVSDLEGIAQETKDYINNTLPGILNDIQAQLDGQIEQFFESYDPTTSNAPASGWITTSDKEAHLGDLFYNTSTGKVFRWIKQGNVYSWQELKDSEVAQALALANDALALAGQKRRIFTNTPYTPYEVGDLWVQGATGDIMRCKTKRDTGNFLASDWEKASKYTDDAALTNFINGNFKDTVDGLLDQLDGKIESWFQSTDPASNWTTSTERAKHKGDMWYNTSLQKLKRYSGTAWNDVTDKTALDAYEAAAAAQDTADGKRRVFVSTPVPPYDVGDLWLTGGSADGTLKRCITARGSGSYIANDWAEAVCYDNTQTTINGGIVTSGTVQLAGTNGAIKAGITGEGTAETSVRMWAGTTKSNRANAPFRVQQNGEVWATNAHITGEVNATSGVFHDVQVNGSTRSPFEYAGDSFDTDYTDNVVMISSGGGWIDVYSLPWTTKQSGRKLTIVNYKWGSSIAYGVANISAPSGKYFFEDGVAKSSLSLSRECVELLGYGDKGTFYGWIVLKRINLMTSYRYGKALNVLAFGKVTGTASSASISYKTFDGTTLSVKRTGTGKYVITMPSTWFGSSSDVLCIATGEGAVWGASEAWCKPTILSKTTTQITVGVSDDSSANDGSFNFLIVNMNDWIYTT